jgi:hypothetical protein
LQVRRRTADDPEDFACRRLLPEGLGQRTILLIQDLVCHFLPLEAFRQAFLELATVGGFASQRLAGGS